jgi:thioesterase domain-containing protein
VKVRGFRIELDEIAAVLLRQPGVADAVVISVPDALGEASLRAYVVAQDEVDVVDRWPLALREQIARVLPNYMLPSAIVVLADLPRTPNGKIDRAALPLSQAASVAEPSPTDLAQTPTEIIVAGFAQDLLGRPSIGRNEDLFTLGFHSLLAVRFVAKLADRSGTRLALRAVFDHPTVAGVAALIDEASARTTPQAAPGAAPIVVYHAAAAGPPFIFFHSDAQAEGMYCRKLSAAIGRDVRFVAIAPHGSAGLPVMPSMEAMARDYVARIKQIEPTGPYRIGGHCVGGIVAYAVARLLREGGDEVERLVLVNSYAPQRLQLPGVDWFQRRVGLDARLGWRLREKICLNLVRFTECVDRGPAAVLRFVRARIATATRLRERELQNALAHPEIFEREPGTPETEAYFAYTIAGFTYHPAQPYTGPLTLVLSDNEDVSMGDPNAGDPTIGWRKLATDIRLVPFSGGHNSPVQERVGELGAVIAQAFDS